VLELGFCFVVDRFLLVMPGYSSSDDALATKLISFYPENVERPSHQAWIMLFEPTNGDLCAVYFAVPLFVIFFHFVSCLNIYICQRNTPNFCLATVDDSKDIIDSMSFLSVSGHQRRHQQGGGAGSVRNKGGSGGVRPPQKYEGPMQSCNM